MGHDHAPRIVLLVPSRGRPESLRRLLTAVTATAGADVLTVFGIDADDPAHDEYKQLWMELKDDDTIGSYYGLDDAPERRGLVEWTNVMARWVLDNITTFPPGLILGSVGDDHVPETEGWVAAIDSAMRELGPGGGLVFPNDGHRGEELPTAAFWSAEIVRALGWFAPPSLHHMCIDAAWLELGRAIGRRRYLPDVMFRHMHPSSAAGAAAATAHDEVYQAAEAAAAADRAEWQRLRLSWVWRGIVQTARNAIREAEEAAASTAASPGS